MYLTPAFPMRTLKVWNTVIPEYTCGRVVRFLKMTDGGYTLEAEFDFPPDQLSQLRQDITLMARDRYEIRNKKFVIKMVTKDEYDEYLIPV